MLKIKEEPNLNHATIIKMQEMKPLQVGVLIDESDQDGIGHYVMRTASSYHFEVMDITKAQKSACWNLNLLNPDDPRLGLKVRLLRPDEKIIIELSGD